MDARRRHPLVPYVAVPLILLAYVLSYAPMYRLAFGGQTYVLPDGGPLGIYRPVDWMIDREPLRRPLLSWANVCGVGSSFSRAHYERSGSREYDSDIPYPSGSFFPTW
jgi:hypothetical protein